MSGRYAKGNQKMLEGSVSWLTQDFKAVLLTAAYTVDLDADEFLDDLTGVLSTSPNLGSKTSTLGVAGCEDIVFGAVTGAQGTQMVVYRDTGSSATSPLIAHVDSAQAGLPVYPNGGDVVCVVDTVNGLFTL